MEGTTEIKTPGLNSASLRIWGFLFVIFGIIGRGILQNNLLNLNGATNQQLFEAMEQSKTVMVYATLSLIFQVLETCAVPVFAFLLAEGVKHTSDFNRYFLRVAGLAVLCELPYNFAIGGKLVDLSGRNPVFGLVMALAVMYFFRIFKGRKALHIFIRILVVFTGLLWCRMLSIEFGGGLVFMTVVFWLLREKPLLRNLLGMPAILLCGLFSIFYVASPMGFLPLHYYNGEKGKGSRQVTYFFYPVLLLVTGILNLFI